MRKYIFTIMFFTLTAAMPFRVNAENAGKIILLAGNADITSPGGNAVAAEVGSLLNQNDIIRTKSGSKAHIKLADGSILKLSESTRLELSEFSMNDKKPRTLLTLFRGKIQNIVKKTSALLGKPDDGRYRVKTSTAVIGVRGTNFFAYQKPDGLCGALFIEGRGYCYSVQKPDLIREIYAGQVMTAINPYTPPVIRPVTEREIRKNLRETAPKAPVEKQQDEAIPESEEGMLARSEYKSVNGEQNADGFFDSAEVEWFEESGPEALPKGMKMAKEGYPDGFYDSADYDWDEESALETLPEGIKTAAGKEGDPDGFYDTVDFDWNEESALETLPEEMKTAAGKEGDPDGFYDSTNFEWDEGNSPDALPEGEDNNAYAFQQKNRESIGDEWTDLAELNEDPTFAGNEDSGYSDFTDRNPEGQSNYATGSEFSDYPEGDFTSGNNLPAYEDDYAEGPEQWADTNVSDDFSPVDDTLSENLRPDRDLNGGDYPDQNGAFPVYAIADSVDIDGVMGGGAHMAWVDIEQALTGVGGGDFLGTFDPIEYTWQSAESWSLLETETFLRMAETEAGRIQLEALNIPSVEIGRATLQGQSNALDVSMDDVTFFSYRTGGQARIWATDQISGEYSAIPDPGHQVALTGSGLNAEFTVNQWQNGQWAAGIDGEGLLRQNDVSEPVSVQFNGYGTGEFEAGKFSGAGSGLANE